MMSTSERPCVTTFQFALHKDVTLRVSLHKDVTNPDLITKNIINLKDNPHGEKYALMDAKRVISLDQISLAANMALLRLSSFNRQVLLNSNANEKISGDDDSKSNNSNNLSGNNTKKGAAIETIICAAGSTNVGTILKDYTFNPSTTSLCDDKMQKSFTVIFLAFDVSSDADYMNILDTIGLNHPSSQDEMESYFMRPKTQEERKELLKIYKLTQEEVDMNDSSLEKSILNRIGTKFFT